MTTDVASYVVPADVKVETARLILRKPVAKDMDALIAFYSTPRSAFIGGPKDLGAAWRAAAMFLGHWDMRGFGLFTAVRKDTGTGIGLFGPWVPGDWPDTEIGWHLWRAEDEGHGFATEAATAALSWCQETLGWTRIVSYIAQGNDRSIAVAERLGGVPSDRPYPSGKPCLVYEYPKAASC